MGLVKSTIKSESLECLVQNVRADADITSQKSGPTSTSTSSSFAASGHGKPGIRCYDAALLDNSFSLMHKGKLILRTHDLVFRFNDNLSTSSFKWLLSDLRWYGGSTNNFVFECGRRCKLGPGHFIFKCKQSRKLISSIRKQIDTLIRLDTNLNLQSFDDKPTRSFYSNLVRSPNSNTDVNAWSARSLHEIIWESELNQLQFSIPNEITSGNYVTLRQSDHCLGSSLSDLSISPSVTSSYPQLLNTLLESPITHNQCSVGMIYNDGTADHDSESTGQYLIALASHLYVNQTHLIISERAQNTYVELPVESTVPAISGLQLCSS